jgi:hypothetical protein
MTCATADSFPGERPEGTEQPDLKNGATEKTEESEKKI